MPNTDYKEQTSSAPVHYDDELTLKELILNVVEFVKEIFRRWWMVPLCCLLVGYFLSKDYFNHIPQYSSRLTFMLDEDAGSGGGGLGGGLNDLLGGLGGNNSNGLLKIVELFNSRTVIDNAILKTVTINGKQDIIANHFLDEFPGKDLVRDFNGNLLVNFKDIDNFRFVGQEIDSLNQEERIMLKVLYYTTIGHKDIKEVAPIIRSDLNEDTGIMTLTTMTTSEDLTLAIGDAVYEKLSSFFIDKAVEKQKKLYDIINFKKDSVGTALRLAEFKLADYENKNRNMTNYKGFLEKMKLQREKSILTVMYSSIVKNMESADFALRSKTPYVQVIDRPFRPLSPSRVSFGFMVIKSVFIGTLLAIILIVFRKIIVDALAS